MPLPDVATNMLYIVCVNLRSVLDNGNLGGRSLGQALLLGQV